jgi:murein DD-endopeptidase MepM/ murein hydrolase activator NlpD
MKTGEIMKNYSKDFTWLTIAVIITTVIFLLGFYKVSGETPNIGYRVYLDGQSLGFIRKKEALETYINQQQTKLKEQYNVDKIYAPIGLEIEKELTYHKNYLPASTIYNKIKHSKPFTVEGYAITIKGLNETKVNVIDQDVFLKAADKTIKGFVDPEEYERFLANVDKKITDVGRKIEDIYIDEEITIKRVLISTNELIFTDVDLLSKYLLFGTLEEQETYIVQPGDNIEKVAFNNMLSIDEFMVANPEFTDINNLLYPTQQVNIGLINPKFSVVVEEHVVERQVKKYKTEIKYDHNLLVGNGYETQAGVDGEELVTQKIKTINGKIEDVVVVSFEEVRPAINRIYVQGGKAIITVGHSGLWAWPTATPYIITSPYGPRWGTIHEAIDIAGSGYNSPIYAANNGVVETASYGYRSGNYIIINHNNGYYTWYGHLAKMYVRKGQVVERGQIIGTMGNTGYHPLTNRRVGTHLHYGVYIGFPYRGGYSVPPLTLYR